MPEFVHLHNHSHYSLLDAICTIDDLVKSAKEMNMPALALTDHGVMYGAMEFYKKSKEAEIKPILGCEVYMISYGSRLEKGKSSNSVDDGLRASPNGEKNIQLRTNNGTGKKKGGYNHLVLLAKNENGYKNLLKLVSRGHTEGFYYKPRIDIELLRQYSADLIALSACAGGVVSSFIINGDLPGAKETAKLYKEIFGEDFYLEIQNHEMQIEQPILKAMPQIAKELGVKLVATNDVHYIKKEHAIAHNIYLYINSDLSRDKEGKDIERDLRYGTDQIYLKSPEEMCKLFKDFPEAIQSTLEIADKCNLELPKGIYHMPNFPIPDNTKAKTLDEYLTLLSHEGLIKKLTKVTAKELDRLNTELEVIQKMKFSGYFLIVADFVKYAKDNDVLVGPGRGSAAGSLVCFALDITDVNPLDYNLLFERFLNPERVSMPDIDIDFQDDKRDEIINYSRQRYGEKAVSQIVTFNKLKTKAVLKDVGRVLNYPFDTINEVTKHVPSIFGKIKSLQDCYKEIPEFKQYFDADQERKKLLRYSVVLENLNKNASMHASGVVIAPSDITDHSPVCKTPQLENTYMTQYDMKMLEDAGLIKMDFLGLKELKILQSAIMLVEKRHNEKIDLRKLPLDDDKTYDIFSHGYTIGVFQFSKPKMREYLSKLKPRDLNDLAAMNALYRPGPMDLIPEFIDKKHGKKDITYLHPKMEAILNETYGIIVYQEQVMQLVRDIAGYSLGKADIVRRAMGKKDEKLMKQQEKEFISGAEENGVDKKTAKDIFNLIMKFADYGFNKSHSVAYSILAYYTAYMKAHYPLEFMTSQLNCRKDDMDEMVILINECRRMKINLSLPNINECYADYTINEKGQILFGLSSIKNVGSGAVDLIVKEREANGIFHNFADFCSRIDTRIINKKTIESLIFAGAFDGFEPNRKKLFDNYEGIIAQCGTRKTEMLGQSTLFGGKGSGDYHRNIISSLPNNVEDWSNREKLSFEKSVIGLYLSSHPLAKFEKEINSLSTLKFGDAEDLATGRIDTKGNNVRMSGIISDVKIKQSKRGNRFCVFMLEDFTGQGECVVFPKVYEHFREQIKNEEIVTVIGKPEENGNTIKLIVDEIISFDIKQVRDLIDTGVIKDKNAISKPKDETVSNYRVKIDPVNFSAERLLNLKTVFENNSGNCSIIFDIVKDDSKHEYIEFEHITVNEKRLIELFGNENIIVN